MAARNAKNMGRKPISKMLDTAKRITLYAAFILLPWIVVITIGFGAIWAITQIWYTLGAKTILILIFATLAGYAVCMTISYTIKNLQRKVQKMADDILAEIAAIGALLTEGFDEITKLLSKPVPPVDEILAKLKVVRAQAQQIADIVPNDVPEPEPEPVDPDFSVGGSGAVTLPE